jgi:hypothetical protein
MAFEVRDNSGSLFRNERKDKDSHPDYTGNGMIDGKGYWFSAWIKKDRNGKSFMSLSFKPKEDQHQREQPRKDDRISTGRHSYTPGGKVTRNDDMNDDIPF